ncbi:hypothetical protein I545_4941 [Mycobacterium kansasii 662]|uniref:Uncharacterized protein n=2 Tax=Mycobacterium kansasii TaxID=1768 RepID=A0A1V3WY84_MYCKA|nr:hypothetical protein I547_2636 [Mycobacterium kansasii 824]EUA12536.1 hypothetical protein I545_4941 [Mycobacterium kansasii 662]KEP39039.1 hypothetical protein MKSMC1_60240 [Mycobacterium kansasii]OOK71211.1 hypothetical protein BZL29_5576 [Mycobacterium kansasii]OOK76361.1 hypothetical protein BZL30_4042 [Mycobacterium kansasii]
MALSHSAAEMNLFQAGFFTDPATLWFVNHMDVIYPHC